VHRKVELGDRFVESWGGLDRLPETIEAFARLMLRAKRYPESAPTEPGSNMRIMRTRAPGSGRMMHLFYGIDEETLALIWVEYFDELED